MGLAAACILEVRKIEVTRVILGIPDYFSVKIWYFCSIIHKVCMYSSTHLYYTVMYGYFVLQLHTHIVVHIYSREPIRALDLSNHTVAGPILSGLGRFECTTKHHNDLRNL